VGYCPEYLQYSPDAAQGPGVTRWLPSCLQVAGETGSALLSAIQIPTFPTEGNFLSYLLEIISASFT